MGIFHLTMKIPKNNINKHTIPQNEHDIFAPENGWLMPGKDSFQGGCGIPHDPTGRVGPPAQHALPLFQTRSHVVGEG